MRILTHPVHTAWEYEFAKTGHEIFTVAPDDFKKLAPDWWGVCRGTITGGPVWDTKNRPLPDNVRVISLEAALRMHFDVCVVHTLAWLEELRGVSCPFILKVHVMPAGEDFIPAWAEKLISAITLNGEMAMRSAVTKRRIPKNVIRVPVDSAVFEGYVGSKNRCLAIANLIGVRPEKRPDRLDKIASLAPVDLVGGGNESIPYAVGEARSFEELVSFYKDYAVFLDVADHINMSRLEAMMTGMPVVMFSPAKHQELFKNGENCIAVKTEDEAAEAIRELLNDPVKRKTLGENARSSVRTVFDAAIFRREWNQLLERVVRDGKKK